MIAAGSTGLSQPPPTFSPQTGLFYVNATRAFSVYYIYDPGDNPQGWGGTDRGGYGESMLQAIGAPMMQAALPVMRGITDMFSSMGNFANRNAGTVTAIIGVMQELGSILAKIGGFAIEKIAALSGVSGMFRIFGDLPWERIREGLAGFNSGVSSLATIAWEKIVTMFDGIKNAVMGFVGFLESIAGKLKSPFSNPNGANRGDGDSVGRGMNQPMRFTPGTGGPKKEQYAFALNIDGERIAQTIINKMEAIYGFPTGAPSPDGSGKYFAGDHNFADV